MNYRDEIVKAMGMLAKNRKVLFVGQSVKYPGHAMFNTLEDAKVPMGKRIELPVFEDTQLGICTGLALEGYIPLSIYPRMDFLIIAMNQLVNHLDKIEQMSRQHFRPKVIIRTMIGSKVPLDGGPQHTQDHTEGLVKMLTNINVYKLEKAEEIMPAYQEALNSDKSSIVIELGDLY